jgi:tetratricopeptide (TPR) repeat protein
VGKGQHGSNTGVIAGHDVTLKGEVVAGRDVNLQIVRPAQSAMPSPFQLPRDTHDFTDRDAAVDELRSVFEAGQDNNGTAVVVSAIAGTAGVGKTALATRVAHQLRERFPDGQLYANLRGGEDQPQPPGLVLGEFLLGLGVARRSIPEDLADRAARYRSQLAGHRILVVLDNAVDEEQVHLLLPGSPGSAALITSRSALSGLPGVRHFNLDVLELADGVELLARIAGPERVAAAPRQAERIVRLCGRLPLAVRIAGGKLAARRHWTLKALADRLDNDHTRLSELKLRDLEVRASFELSYRDLGDDERRAFRLLALLKAPDFTAWVASALFNCELAEAEELLDRLVEAQVLQGTWEPEAGEVRYRFHDLLRAFARERLWTEEPPALQEAALHRALDAHVVLAEHAAGRLEPGGDDVLTDIWWLSTRSRAIADRVAANPGAWFSAERVNIISALEQAYEQSIFDVVWRLARSLNYFVKLQNHWSDWKHTQQLALSAARQTRIRIAEANALRSLGDVATHRRKFEQAADHFTEALKLFVSLGELRGEAWTRIGLGNADLDRGHPAEALDQFGHGLRHFRRMGDRRGEAWALLSFGIVDRFQWRLSEAEHNFRRALTLFQAERDLRGKAYCSHNLGIVHRNRSEFDDALSWFDKARPIFHELGDHHGETYVLLNIGHMLREQGQHEEALAILRVCLATFREFGEESGEVSTLLNLGMVWQAQGLRHEAIAQFHQCLTRFRDLHDRRGEAWTLLGLGQSYLEEKRLRDALACFDRALPILQRLGDQPGWAKALRSKALVLAAAGHRHAALFVGWQAVHIFHQLGASEASDVVEWLRTVGR